jgi:hypothetical protein
MRDLGFLTGFATLAALLTACSDGGGAVICRVNADCASNVCLPDGTCLPAGDDADVADADPTTPDADPTAPDAGPAADAATAVCSPSGDFQITRAENPVKPGLEATFRVAVDATIPSTAGSAGPGGRRAWDLAGALAGDTAMLLETLPVEGQWFADDFAGATYAIRLSETSDLLGVFELTDTALLLRGVVSPQKTGAYTELTYTPPATILSYPVEKGKSWSSTSEVTGTASGVPIVGFTSEKYESLVEYEGTLATPFGQFDRVVRVTTKLTRTVGLQTTIKQSHAFVTECFGTVATITSKDNPASKEFTSAAEVRRLAP